MGWRFVVRFVCTAAVFIPVRSSGAPVQIQIFCQYIGTADTYLYILRQIPSQRFYSFHGGGYLGRG